MQEHTCVKCDRKFDSTYLGSRPVCGSCRTKRATGKVFDNADLSQLILNFLYCGTPCGATEVKGRYMTPRVLATADVRYTLEIARNLAYAGSVCQSWVVRRGAEVAVQRWPAIERSTGVLLSPSFLLFLAARQRLDPDLAQLTNFIAGMDDVHSLDDADIRGAARFFVDEDELTRHMHHWEARNH